MLVKSERNKLGIYVILLSCKSNIKNKQRFLQKNLNLIFHVSLWIFDLKKRIILVRGQNFASGGQNFATGGQNFVIRGQIFSSMGPKFKILKKFFFKKVIFQHLFLISILFNLIMVVNISKC